MLAEHCLTIMKIKTISRSSADFHCSQYADAIASRWFCGMVMARMPLGVITCFTRSTTLT